MKILMVTMCLTMASRPTISKKVTDMVGTFLNENRYGFQVSAIQMASEKVAATVATFLTNC